MKTTCSNCSKTVCAKQTAKDKKIVLFCSGYKPIDKTPKEHHGYTRH